jgi:VWFA-related protein
MSRIGFLGQALLCCLLITGIGQTLAFCAQQSAPTAPVPVPATTDPSGAATLRFLAVDRAGNPIVSMHAEELSVRIGNVERKVVSLLRTNEEPRTMGLFFDVSGSRRFDKVIPLEVQATAKFLESVWRRGDGGFVVDFNDAPYTIVKPTTDLQQIQAGLQMILREDYRGSTALYDALCSVRFGPEAEQREKLFIVVSDFEDNTSHESAQVMIQKVRKVGARVFPLLRIRIEDETQYPHKVQRIEKTAGEVARKTGGDFFMVTSKKDLDEAFQRLASELQGAYRLTYEPLPTERKPGKLELQTTRGGVRLLFAKD